MVLPLHKIHSSHVCVGFGVGLVGQGGCEMSGRWSGFVGWTAIKEPGILRGPPGPKIQLFQQISVTSIRSCQYHMKDVYYKPGTSPLTWKQAISLLIGYLLQISFHPKLEIWRDFLSEKVRVSRRKRLRRFLENWRQCCANLYPISFSRDSKLESCC